MKTSFEADINSRFFVRDFFQLLRLHVKLFYYFFLIAAFAALLFYKYSVPYVSKGRLLVNDSQNSSLQAFSTSYFGMTKSVVDGKKGNTQTGKQIEVLRTREFYYELLDKIEKRGQSSAIGIDEQEGFKYIKDKYLDEFVKDESSRQKLILKIDSWFQAKMESDYEIRVVFATPNKSLSLFLTNTALELASEFLRDREMAEIRQVESFISEQRQEVDKNIKKLTQEAAEFQMSNDNLITMTSREKMGEYLSDLMVRINETRLKIAENKKDIEFLEIDSGLGPTELTNSSLYGSGGRAEFLKLENKLLNSRLSQLHASVKELGNNLKRLPVTVQILDDKRKKSELEYAKYKELSETLSKIEAQKLSVRDRFEVLERARGDNTSPQVELVTLIFLAIVISLTMGLIIIYIKSVWNFDLSPASVVPSFVVVDTDEDSEGESVFS